MEQKNGNLIKAIIQGGLAGSLVLTLILFYLVVSNHITHNTEVLIKVETSINNSIISQKEMLQAQRETSEAIKQLNNNLILLKR